MIITRVCRDMAAALAGELRVVPSLLRTVSTGTAWGAFAVACLAVLWAYLGWLYPEAVFASPVETAEAFYWMLTDRHADYLFGIGATLTVFFTGFLAAIIAGSMLVMIMGLLPFVGRAVSPALDLLGSVPNIAFMPMMVALLGLGNAPKIAVVFLAAILPVVISSHAARRQVDRTYEEVALSLGASRIQAHLMVLWPVAAAPMVAGMRVAAIQGLAACVVAEIYTAMTGLGGLLVGYGNSFRMSRYFVIVLTLALVGTVTTTILRRIETVLARRAQTGD
jgi:NitT/TauT family transport system permease protein